jgi:hypothetical protein
MLIKPNEISDGHRKINLVVAAERSAKPVSSRATMIAKHDESSPVSSNPSLSDNGANTSFCSSATSAKRLALSVPIAMRDSAKKGTGEVGAPGIKTANAASTCCLRSPAGA